MVAGIVNTSVEAVKFLDGDKIRVCVGAVLSPGASTIADQVFLEVCLLGSFRAQRCVFSLSDMVFYDATTGSYKTSFVAENVPKSDVGILIIAKVVGVEDNTIGAVVCKGGEMIGDKSFDLTSSVLVVNPTYHTGEKRLSVRNSVLRFDENSKNVVGDFDIDSASYSVEHVFVRLFRFDMDDQERLVDDVTFSKDVPMPHVQFVDDAFSQKTYGKWGYKGTVSAKDKERTFLVDFIDRMSWEVLTLKEVSDSLSAENDWDCVSLTWKVAKNAIGDKYLASRTVTLGLLESFEDEFGTNHEISLAKLLLGERVLSFEALTLFFDFCFVLLESAEARHESLPLVEMLPFEIQQELDATAVVRA